MGIETFDFPPPARRRAYARVLPIPSRWGSNWNVKRALASSPLRMLANIVKPRLETIVDNFIQSGTRFLVEVGTNSKPGLVRWTTWGNNDIQQSYLLSARDGAILVDPIQPIGRQALNALKKYADGRFQAVICTSPNHERDVEWFRERFRIPVYGPELAPALSRIRLKSDVLYRDGEVLPGNIRAIWSGDRRGEMWLHWGLPVHPEF